MGPQPGEFCRQALAALASSDGRRRRRARDTTPDAIGLALKRDLLEQAAAADPPPERFEAWLLEQALGRPAAGPARAVGAEILAEYQLACHDPTFRSWLAQGAPSADAEPDQTGQPAGSERMGDRRRSGHDDERL